jgi:ABC-type transporter Mla subunit MlaD
MADATPITVETLKQVLDRLNDVLAEAARLRKDVVRQLGEQRAGQQQHLSNGRKRKTTRRKRPV